MGQNIDLIHTPITLYTENGVSISTTYLDQKTHDTCVEASVGHIKFDMIRQDNGQWNVYSFNKDKEVHKNENPILTLPSNANTKDMVMHIRNVHDATFKQQNAMYYVCLGCQDSITDASVITLPANDAFLAELVQTESIDALTPVDVKIERPIQVSEIKLSELDKQKQEDIKNSVQDKGFAIVSAENINDICRDDKKISLSIQKNKNGLTFSSGKTIVAHLPSGETIRDACNELVNKIAEEARAAQQAAQTANQERIITSKQEHKTNKQEYMNLNM